METIYDIQVKVANDIKDPNFVKVTRAEYSSAVNIVAEKIAREVPLFLHKYELTIAVETRFLDLPLTRNAEVYVQNPLGVVEAQGGLHVFPISIEKVVRYNQDCREFSFQAIESASRGNSAFKTNDTQLDFRAYCTRMNPDGTLRLEFITPMQVNDEIQVYVTLRLPLQSAYSGANVAGNYSTPKWKHFKDRVMLPQLIIQSVYKSLRAEIVGTLMVREPQPWGELFPVLKQEAIEEVYSLKRYILNMKDKSSMGQIQPFKFLSEHEDENYITNPNIPEEWVSKIII